MVSRSFAVVLLSSVAFVLLSSPARAQATAALAVGESHACVIVTTGGVKCWGLNSAGQLGVGTRFNRYSAVDLSGLTSGVVALASGSAHTCAVTAAGGVKCWGENDMGQLGDGTLADRTAPVDVSGLASGVAAVAAGREHTCALTAAGGVKCWGRNLDGQLGDGTTTDRTTPIDVSGLASGVAAIVASGWHTCALTNSGGVKCWGYNGYGELGDGTTTSRSAATDVAGLTTGVAKVAGGIYHSCAVTTNGTAECWGRNNFGQVGDGTTTDRLTPVAVSGLTGNVAMLGSSEYRTCAVTTAGGARCWGANSAGGVGDGTTLPRSSPVDVTTLTSGVAAIGTGAGHSCAVTTAGGVQCWGLNTSGQVGDGTNTTRLAPVPVAGLVVTPNGGTITGTVTDAATSAPVPGVDVQVFSSTGIPTSSGYTNASGVYSIQGLPSGSYRVRTSVPARSLLMDQIYPQVRYVPGSTLITSGSLVAVSAPGSTSGIDFALARGGNIAGTVIDGSTGQGVNATVWVYTTSGILVGSASTDGQGDYTSPGLPNGMYFVRTSNAQGLVDEAFNDLSCPGAACSIGTAVPVSVTAQQTTGNVDFVLAPGGAISGTVTNAASGAAAASVAVTFFAGTGRSLGAAVTDTDGAYTSPALPPGTYFVRTSNAQGLADQVFNAVACPVAGCVPTSGTPVTVTGTATGAAIDFALVPSGQAGGARVSPGSGPTTGQAIVTIVGSGFWSDATTVTIGGRAASSVVVVSPSLLTAVTPPGTAGTATVTVTTPAGTLTVGGGYLYQTTATAPPFGQVDTPVQNANGVVGAIGVTGWALDDVGVTGVKIYRNCLAFEPQANCQVLAGVNVVQIGDAAFLAGARPDVEQQFSAYPNASRAGWGYLMLTNMLPDVTNGQPYGGQGPLTLYAFATDAEGQSTLLGRVWSGSRTPTTMTLSNSTIARPFGAMDTPGQGQIVRGPLANFGWVLTPDANTSAEAGDIRVPWDGSTVVLYIDGRAVGPVNYGQCRGSVGNPVPAGMYCDDDVASVFGHTTVQPTFTPRMSNPTRYRNLDEGRAAIGSFDIDTRGLTNGMHTIAWGVTDSDGRTEGIGSRFFTVLNTAAGGSPVAGDTAPDRAEIAAVHTAPAMVRGDAGMVEALPLATAQVVGHVGFGDSSLVPVPAGADGTREVRVPELSRVELRLGPVSGGYLVANGTLRDLPPGSRLDHTTGQFTWAPAAGYIGTYMLRFVSDSGQVPVAVTIEPRQAARDGESEIRMHVDLPDTGQAVTGGFRVAGWALDPHAPFGAGIGAVHVWAERTDAAGASPVFLGAADLGGQRPDVAQSFGRQYAAAGFGLAVPGLTPGRYSVTAYAWNQRTRRWEDARTVSIVAR
jgi:alpha-tubulin suppressor-like RCC1 family protein